MMKSIRESTDMRHRTHFRIRMRKLLSGFLAVSTAITMLGGSAATLLAEEPSTEYALAGAGTGEDITIHFGDDEDKSINVHVNPESNAETLAGLGSEAVGDETESETENTGLKEVEAGGFVTISSVDETLLPEEAEASAEILTGKAENAAVEKVEEVAVAEPTSETADPAGSIAQDSKEEMPAGAKNAPEEEAAPEADGKTEYQAFDISLDNVDEEQYQDGFKVEVSLPEDVRGRDFRLFHIHEGEEPVEIPVETVSTIDPETGLEVVSGFEFTTDGFSEFVLQYTVDFWWEVDGKKYEFSIPGGGFVSLEHVVEVLGIAAADADTENGAENAGNGAENKNASAGEVPDAEASDENGAAYEETLQLNKVEVGEATKKFVADVEKVDFSSPELVWVGKADADTTVGGLKQAKGLECEYSAELTEEQIKEINAQTVKRGDWALISLQAFTSEESLTVTMKTGEVLTIKVTDGQIKKTVISASGETYEITVTYGEEAQIPDGAELKVEEILPEDGKYEAYYEQSLETIGVNAPETDNTEEGSDASAVGAVNDSSEGSADPFQGDDNEEETEAPAKRITSDYARIFDIEIRVDGHVVEPAADVTVNIRLLDAPEETKATPQVVHFAEDGAELMTLKDEVENSEDEEIRFVTDAFSVYSVVYTVDFSYEVNGKVYGFTLQGADSVSLRALIDALHVYELAGKEKADSLDRDSKIEAEVTNAELAEQDDTPNAVLDSFMSDIETVTFSDEQLLVPAKVEEDTTVGKIKTDLELFPTYPLGLKQSEVLELNAKEYTAGDWVLISMKPFDTKETLTITMNTGEAFDIVVTDAQDAVMNGDVVQTISNPAGTTIDLFDYWIVSQELVGRDGWGDLNQGQGAAEAGDDKPLNGTGNNKGINSSSSDSEHGHALKFSPAWAGTVYNGNKIGTTGNAWQSVNLDMRDGLNSYTGDEYTWHWNCPNPFTGIVQNNLYNGYPILTNNQNIGTNGESLAYLFNPGVSHAGKASYAGVNQLLYVDKDGYYTYDSRDYAAAFNTGNKTFTLTEQTSTNSEIRGFWPFGIQNFWTGMHVNTQFSMPSGGQVLNPSGVLKPMQFEFSGDDDVWIYVDGILIGDAGGIHNRSEVDINFQTGSVSISGQPDKYLDDLFRTGLRDRGKTEAEIGAYITQNFDGHTLKAGTYHTFDFFYLERGGGESNLYIHYNLVSTADFTAHKAYYGADETDLLRRDQFRFELIGLDGKYRSVKNNETGNYELVQADTTSDAIMPHADGSGEGTVASPHYEDNVSMTLSNGGTVNSQVYITGVTEDGNINFGSATISEMDMNEADQDNPPVYKYIIREIVPEDAVNQDGITWASATDAQKAAGGFVKDQVTYDGTVYYMTGRVTSWTETDASGQEVVRHGISKTYYTDDTYTTVKDDVNFAGFENRFTPDYGSVDFTKVDGAGNPLEGAEFTLYKDEACTVPAADLDTEGHPVWTAASDSNGKVSFENVRVGTYYMKETKAPSQYALDETVYKVVIEDSRDKTRKSKITILGDEEETSVTQIANARTGKISVVKKWIGASGTEIDGGSNSATVWLKRKHMVAEEGGSSGTHTVTVQMTVEDGGVRYGMPVTQTVTGDTVVIEWDDEWQRNFNWNLTVGDQSYEGWIGDEVVATDHYTFKQISVDGRSRRLTIPNVQGNVSFTTKYWVNWLHSDNNHWNNLNSPVITGAAEEPDYVAAEDTAFNNEKYTQVLSGSSWSHTWNIGGTESSHNGFDFPAMDDNGRNYLYYVVELDAQGNAIEAGGSPLEGYVLQGYSANNNTGISSQGVITVYNRAEGSDAINVVIKKTDNAKNSTNYLDGAVFKLKYRSDSSGKFTNVSNENVPELDADSQFTVPAAGIKLTGLVDGEYQLQEISSPSGYVITNSIPVTFIVSGGAITSTEGTITGVRYTAAAETSDAEFIVPNEPGAVLPATGGPGTNLVYLIGLMLMAFAGAGLVMRRRTLSGH